MRSLPLSLIEAVFRLPFLSRPAFLADIVSECPSCEELHSDVVLIEMRGGHLKWAHLQCPRCGDHIQLPLAGNGRWTIEVDFFRRPTLAPSIWEQTTCAAHFFVRKGKLEWCR
jgi:Family of unknown function (DUF6527)